MTNKNRIEDLENNISQWRELFLNERRKTDNMLLQLTKLTAKVNKLEVELGEIER